MALSRALNVDARKVAKTMAKQTSPAGSQDLGPMRPNVTGVAVLHFQGLTGPKPWVWCVARARASRAAAWGCLRIRMRCCNPLLALPWLIPCCARAS